MRLKFITGFLLLFALSTTCLAQTSTQMATLQKTAKSLNQIFNTQYRQTLKKAKLKQWPTFIEVNGGKAQLLGTDFLGYPKYLTTHNNTTSAATTNTQALWDGGSSGLNLSGSYLLMGGLLGIWDGGRVRGTHVELANRVQQMDNPADLSNHATHVAGTMIATGINPNARGMSYGAPGLNAWDFSNDLSEIAANAANLLVSNHSYGILSGWTFNSNLSRWEFRGEPGATEDYKFGYYSQDAQTLDSIAYNAPNYLIVKSAGNNRSQNGPAVGAEYFRFNESFTMVNAGARPEGMSSNNGYDIIPWDGNAKNILTVGAISGLPNGYSKPSDAVISSFSSWGPTDDGRIKPDIVGAGVSVLSTNSSADDAYGTSSGTSMSAPNVSGSLFLLQEHYARTNGNRFMRSASLKGLAIHTANECGTNPGPDYIFGWGLLNTLKAAEIISSKNTGNHLLREEVLNNGATNSYQVVASGKGKLVVTICWTDVKGEVAFTNYLNNRTPRLVNDLDVRVSLNGETFFPWKLDPANPAAAAFKGDNILDNVEKIEIDNPIPGATYTITVSHKNTLARGSQAYSLLASGVGGTAFCNSAPTSNAGTRIDSVVIGTVRFNNPNNGCTNYTVFGSGNALIRPGQTLNLKVGVSACDATQTDRIIKAFIDFNGNNIFDTNELVATSSIIAGTGGLMNINFTAPSNLIVGNLIRMRVVAQETNNAANVQACGNYSRGETQDFVLSIISAENDLKPLSITAPANNSCANNQQLLTVLVQNTGTADMNKFRVGAVITDLSNNTKTTIASTFPSTLTAGSTFPYTIQQPFNAEAGKQYAIQLFVNATNDQVTSNDSLTVNYSVAPSANTINATAKICGDTAYLKVNNAIAGSNYFWYTQPNGVNISRGTSVKTPIIPANKSYQVTSGTRGTIGLSSKYVFTGGAGGSYLTSGTTNYMIYNAAVPVILESARIYSRFGGRVNIYAADLNNSTFTFLTSTSLDIYTTSNNPAPGSASNDNTDTGAVFQINLPLPSGTHNLLVIPQGNANIFRNNNIPSSNATYPMSIPNLITITGNGATTPNSFYYYLYDMKIRTQECVSNATTVIGTDAPTPTITRNGANLISSSSTGNQWYNGSTLIVGANNATYTPTSSGTYAVVVTDSDGCSKRSADFSFTLLPVQLQVFTGKMMNGVNNLEWETANEVNSAYFSIEYSTDGSNFAECGRVKSAGISVLKQFYNFQHLPGNQLLKHYYRLKMIDNDGSFNYSPVIVIEGIASTKKLSFYPNPVRKNQPIQIHWNQLPTGKYDIQLLNTVGKQIAVQTIHINSAVGNMNIVLPTENITKGFYLIQIIGTQIKEVQKVWIE